MNLNIIANWSLKFYPNSVEELVDVSKRNDGILVCIFINLYEKDNNWAIKEYWNTEWNFELQFAYKFHETSKPKYLIC